MVLGRSTIQINRDFQQIFVTTNSTHGCVLSGTVLVSPLRLVALHAFATPLPSDMLLPDPVGLWTLDLDFGLFRHVPHVEA